MGILDTLLKNPGAMVDMAKFAVDNPQIAQAAMSLVSSDDTSVGGSAGLSGILDSLNGAGLGDAVSSWLGNGENSEIDAAQLQAALGDDTISQFAEKAGIGSIGDATSLLSGVLPKLVDQLSPDGNLPDASSLDNALGGLLGKLA